MEITNILEKLVGPGRVLTSEVICQRYQFNCWLGREWEMKSDIVVLAETMGIKNKLGL